MSRPVGLRMRLVLALLATSLVTLGASFATLVPSLDHRLERDRLNELRVVARTARFAIRGLPENVFERGTAGARRVVLDLQRRTGGHVALFLPDGTPIVVTAPEGHHPAPVDELQQVRDMHLPRVTDVREGVRDGEAILISGVQRPGGDRLILVMRKPLDDTRAAADTVRRALPLALAVGLAVALLVALALSRSLLVRLRRLREDARALGSEGLRHRIEVGPPDEVGEVAGALEAMRSRLVAEEEARQAFLATASHELRTPLATLQATLELMDEDVQRAAPVDPAVLHARAASALRQTHRLTGLATDLLDLSRVDGEAPLSADPLELVECVAMVRDDATEALGAAGRTLEVTGAAPVHARADPAAVRRILHVLLDNARAYGAGTVRLDVARDGGDALVVVTDEGPGLTVEDRDHVFERFRRGEAGHASPGFGLGLPIARGLAERMGGTLSAPEAPRGARFELRLPGWSPEG
ncbi:HAMP domain-containing histidine kinase [Paraconexibacter antarcticus]|uniref:histidine kinase n=1 Tax=Paraconexibacter antarcticus TaxID=2949664 RepID=A0ABY5DR14_9ACTN|nr:HAMP domain-containing sensor histidine kinase [Paraconexibacter antarcticus]UTI64476.1 HAMP domain-containing histidine kinase [Paraconexibacter antarcticus]